MAGDNEIQNDIPGAESWPRIRLKKLEMVNFGCHENVIFDFTGNGKIINLSCLVGPNGTGKTTVLNAIQNLCSDFSSYDPVRYFRLMAKSVNNVTNMTPTELLELGEKPKMSLKGTFCRDDGTGEYAVELNQIRVVSEHPADISSRLGNYCFYARFDMELHTFQLKRSRWPAFQELFSQITGFPVEEDPTLFSISPDKDYDKLLKDYVLGFRFKKGDQIVTQRQCSSGERKIAKCFSTILNKPVIPSIILVDNATMHVESGRHLAVIDSLERCFSESQIIATCHSTPVMKSIARRERLIDMRYLSLPDWMSEEPWRLRLIDDVSEAIERIRGVKVENPSVSATEGMAILEGLKTARNADNCYDDLITPVCEFLGKIPLHLKGDLESTPSPRARRSGSKV